MSALNRYSFVSYLDRLTQSVRLQREYGYSEHFSRLVPNEFHWTLNLETNYYQSNAFLHMTIFLPNWKGKMNSPQVGINIREI